MNVQRLDGTQVLAPRGRRAIVDGMTLEAWTKAGWLRTHGTQLEDIQHLWTVAMGDLRDADTAELSPALRFEYAYNAALKFCIIALYAEGLRPGQVSDVHHKILRSLPLTLGPAREVSADYLDACRERRDRLGADGAAEIIGVEDARGLIEFARELSEALRAWLAERHPQFSPVD